MPVGERNRQIVIMEVTECGEKMIIIVKGLNFRLKTGISTA